MRIINLTVGLICMGAVTFPTTVAIANTVPANGNTVPITGLQGITNTSELLAYAALLYQDIHNGQKINFGGDTGALPYARVFDTETDQGVKYLQVIAFIPVRKDYQMFPDGKQTHKQVTQALPLGAGSAIFNA